uniref:galactose-specific lectin nattectin-like n=1 Tax=Semicossyphus pulcher TaxID=241346 RepID=UPI0037E8A3A4
MASAFHLVVLLGLSSGLWMGGNAKCPKKDCCKACPVGWTELNSRCYMFFYEEKDWSGAEDTCIKEKGNLASMHSEKDYSLLRKLVKQATGTDKQTWIGGYDAVKEGHWKWSDGTPFDFTKWGNGEPNNYRKGEHCMELNYSERDHLNDTLCDKINSFICVRDLKMKE